MNIKQVWVKFIKIQSSNCDFVQVCYFLCPCPPCPIPACAGGGGTAAKGRKARKFSFLGGEGKRAGVHRPAVLHNLILNPVLLSFQAAAASFSTPSRTPPRAQRPPSSRPEEKDPDGAARTPPSCRPPRGGDPRTDPPRTPRSAIATLPRPTVEDTATRRARRRHVSHYQAILKHNKSIFWLPPLTFSCSLAVYHVWGGRSTGRKGGGGGETGCLGGIGV